MAVTEVTSRLPAPNKLTVMSLPAITCPVSVPSGKGSGVGDSTGVEVKVGVGDSTGVDVKVGVGDSTGVDDGVGDSTGVDDGVGDSTGVEVNVGSADPVGVGVKVGVGPVPTMVRLVPVEGRSVRTPFPVETRTSQSIAV